MNLFAMNTLGPQFSGTMTHWDAHEKMLFDPRQIDLVFMSESLSRRGSAAAENTSVKPSDHRPVACEILTEMVHQSSQPSIKKKFMPMPIRRTLTDPQYSEEVCDRLGMPLTSNSCEGEISQSVHGNAWHCFTDGSGHRENNRGKCDYAGWAFAMCAGFSIRIGS